MNSFKDLNLSGQLYNAIDDLGFETPTPIQQEAYSVILSGKDIVGIAQTGTGKTYAYMLPILRDIKFSNQLSPRVLIVVPTRELVLQVVENIESLAKYITVRVLGIFGGVNINTQRDMVAQGCDILVATPGRLYDLVLSRSIQLRSVNKFVIDEVDVMLDLGFRFQLTNIFDLLPERRQNIMFSATMTEEVDLFIDDFFVTPQKISIAVSGTPLENISQTCYPVFNFYTKINLLNHLLADKNVFTKVLVFIDSKKHADLVFEKVAEEFGSETGVIHSNKSQNNRIRTIEDFDNNKTRVLITTDVMARGLDLNQISHVINFDTPLYPENYMHRIGRTGRAEQEGKTILFYTQKELKYKQAIEELMSYSIPELAFPEEVIINPKLTQEERPRAKEINANPHKNKPEEAGPSFHEKKDKNKKVNLGGKYRRETIFKYKKPKTKGDKIQNRKNKKRK